MMSDWAPIPTVQVQRRCIPIVIVRRWISLSIRTMAILRSSIVQIVFQIEDQINFMLGFSYSYWSDIMKGVLQGSIIGSIDHFDLILRIDISFNDLFIGYSNWLLSLFFILLIEMSKFAIKVGCWSNSWLPNTLYSARLQDDVF